MGYDAFISYSHAADSQLAPRLQDGMQRMARPWYRRHALNVFRDNTGLTANPGLWSSIAAAMDDAEWFVFLASPEAAASPWVARELQHWLETRDVDHILPVVTDGEWVWDEAGNDFDVARSTAVPAALLGAFAEEPRHIDMRWAHSEDQVDLRHPHFRDDVAAVAAPMHGLAKDELVGEDVRQHRRTMRWAWGAAAALVLLTLGSAAATVLAVRNADAADSAKTEAEENAVEADANASEASRQKAIADENAAEAAAKAQEALENEQEADANATTAQQQQSLAEQNADEASRQRSAAEASALDAQAQATEAARQAQAALDARDSEELAKSDALFQAQAALRAQAEAVQEQQNAEHQERVAQYERASALFAAGSATIARDEAEVARQEAETQALASASVAQSSEDPALSLLLAVEANTSGATPAASSAAASFQALTGTSSPVGRRALFEAVTAAQGGSDAYPVDKFLPIAAGLADPPAFLWRPTLSLDGRWLAAAEFPNPLTGTQAPFPSRVFVWDLEAAGADVKVLVGHEHIVGNLTFGSGGTLVTQDSSLDGQVAPTVRVWNVESGTATHIRQGIPFVAPRGDYIAVQLQGVGMVEFIDSRTRTTTARHLGSLAPDLYATPGPHGAEPVAYGDRAFSADGRYALGTSGGIALLWDLRAGGRVAVPLITPDGFFSDSPSVDPSGQIATAVVDGVKLVFFRPSDGLPLLEEEIAGPTEILLNTVWSKDGSRFGVLIYDWTTGATRILVAIGGESSWILDTPTCEFGLGFAGQCEIAFTLNGNLLTLEVPTDFTGFTFFTEVIDSENATQLLTFDGRILAAGGPDGSLIFGQHVDANGAASIFVEDVQQRRTVFADDASKTAVAVVADSERLAVATEDGSVRVWTLADGRGPIDVVSARGLMIGLVIDSTGLDAPGMYGVGIGASVTRWDLSRTGAADLIGNATTQAALLDDGESVVEPDATGHGIVTRNLLSGDTTPGAVLEPAEQIDYLLTRSPTGPVVANLADGTSVVTSGDQVVGRLPSTVTDISRNGNRLVQAPSATRVVDVVEADDPGSVVHSIDLAPLPPDDFPGIADLVTLDADGQRLAATNATGEVVVWDVTSGAVIAELPGLPADLRSFPLFGLSFSPQGDRLVLKSPSNLVRMWSTSDWSTLANQQISPRDTAGRVVFSPDGEFVAVDGLFLFDATTLQPTARLVSGTGVGTKFSADNRFLSTITDFGEVLRWDISVSALSDEACETAGRNMTRQEWARYMGTVPYRATCPAYPVED